MKQHYPGIVLIAAVAGLGLLTCPATAQDSSGKTNQSTEIERQQTDLDAEGTTLYDALNRLFSQVRCNFTMDESLKSLTVNAHLSKVPFRIALDTLLKSTSETLTCTTVDGVYQIRAAKKEPKQFSSDEGITVRYTDSFDEVKPGVRQIRVYNLSDIDIVQAFGGTILNLGIIPGFGFAGSMAQNARGAQTGSFFEGGDRLIATGHGTIIVLPGTGSTGK